ncbi:hypothetical protein NBRC116591_39820 [Sessilibacter corallicola]|uniref:Uncharacterized protein n=1 Tax=Sessilibacter corallicola TaxID=2904075 RepID=A0ABQ0AEU6_9GAMM
MAFNRATKITTENRYIGSQKTPVNYSETLNLNKKDTQYHLAQVTWH